MKNKLALAACALLSVGSAIAAEEQTGHNTATGSSSIVVKEIPEKGSAEQHAAPTGFGSGSLMGSGGSIGSASSLAGGFGSPAGNSGAGTQSFGGGFTAGAGSGPLSPPAAGGAVGVMGGAPGGPLGLFR